MADKPKRGGKRTPAGGRPPKPPGEARTVAALVRLKPADAEAIREAFPAERLSTSVRDAALAGVAAKKDE